MPFKSSLITHYVYLLQCGRNQEMCLFIFFLSNFGLKSTYLLDFLNASIQDVAYKKRLFGYAKRTGSCFLILKKLGKDFSRQLQYRYWIIIIEQEENSQCVEQGFNATWSTNALGFSPLNDRIVLTKFLKQVN